jgi:hypothetical protein
MRATACKHPTIAQPNASVDEQILLFALLGDLPVLGRMEAAF